MRNARRLNLILLVLIGGCASNDEDRYDRLGRAKEYGQDIRVNENRYESKTQNSPAAGQRLQGPPPYSGNK